MINVVQEKCHHKIPVRRPLTVELNMNYVDTALGTLPLLRIFRSLSTVALSHLLTLSLYAMNKHHKQHKKWESQ